MLLEMLFCGFCLGLGPLSGENLVKYPAGRQIGSWETCQIRALRLRETSAQWRNVDQTHHPVSFVRPDFAARSTTFGGTPLDFLFSMIQAQFPGHIQ